MLNARSIWSAIDNLLWLTYQEVKFISSVDMICNTAKFIILDVYR